jgi:hypothetical protein
MNPAIDTLGVAELLTISRAAHLEYRSALRDDRKEDLLDALKRAANARYAAHRLDPDHLAPAWLGNMGLHEHGPATHQELHDSLMNFYQQELARLTDGKTSAA